MKKFLILSLTLLLLFFALSFSSCNKSEDLSTKVSALRETEYTAESENYKLRAFYGFRETPFNFDGTHGDKIYGLSFRLLDKETTDVEYYISIEFNGETRKTKFKLNEVNHCLSAFIELKDFKLKEFNATISSGSQSEKMTFSSIVKEGTLSYTEALDKLLSSQQALINSYRNEQGEFIGEIHMRIIVKNEKTYWYVALIKEDSTKALLVDGITGEVLAIRKVM